jgi:uncharacterized protein (DUF362 family)
MATGTDLERYYRDCKVAIDEGDGGYCSQPPFHPSVQYPEYDSTLGLGSEVNPAYRGVREALLLLGLDAAHAGTKEWNPLGEVVHPGDTVVIKPNFVLSDHYRGGNLFSLITHPSVLRAVVDYTFMALQGNGRILIADTPQMDCDFQQLLERTNLRSIQELYRQKRKFDIPIIDLREFWFKYENENYLASQERRHSLPGDPSGSALVNLKEQSAFATVKSKDFYGADFNRDETISHHTGERQEYQISKTILSADVLISVPKLKVHKKVGITLNAKGFVGTVTNKNFLVHFTLGSSDKGGDQFPAHLLNKRGQAIVFVQRSLYDALLAKKSPLANKIFQAFYLPYRKLLKPLLANVNETIVLYDGGNWHGNDSAWRMVSDLSKILLYADRNGIIRSTPQRRIFSLVDGIIAGEGNGPLFPDERRAGIILAGRNHLAVDIVAARLMGFEPTKLRWVNDLLGQRTFDFFLKGIAEIPVASRNDQYVHMFESNDRLLSFRPHPGWEGHIERG